MNHSDDEISRASRERIARIFGVPIVTIGAGQVFGKDLKSSERSDFKFNELDQMLHDIRDVADEQTLERINSGALEVRTVKDYCDHMISCYRTNEKAVVGILGLHRHP